MAEAERLVLVVPMVRSHPGCGVRAKPNTEAHSREPLVRPDAQPRPAGPSPRSRVDPPRWAAYAGPPPSRSAILIGHKLAHYEITALLGEGGMGKVYRARDSKLDRDVALKLLPPAFARDPERVARFQREARTLAALSHPNIAQVHGFEEDGEQRFLVMELVEGEDLSERLARGPLAGDEALEVAEAVARGLEAAHEQGIVHRDLKPANIKLAPDGQVKLLDFGLARALMGDVAEGDDPAASPTITAAFTQAGTILGTAAYMSPEQARGRPVDRRADTWAFGVVLFELLTGEKLFGGETISDTLASVLKEPPDLDRLPTDAPAVARPLLQRCLEKDPRRRLQSIGEARIALERARQGDGATMLSAQLEAGSMGGEAPVAPRRVWPWALALVGVAVLAFGLGRWLAGPAPEAGPSRQFELPLEELRVSYPRNPALSPDGLHLAWFQGDVLRIDDLTTRASTAVQGGDGATACFWSPDGQWLVFGVPGRIYKVPATGGSPVVISEAEFATLDGGCWLPDDTLLLAPDSGPILRVSANGGDPQPWFPPGDGDTDYHTPSALPGGGALFTTHNEAGRELIEAWRDGERKPLLRVEGARLEYATFVPRPGATDVGYMFFHRQSTNPGIWAAPMDARALALTGDPVLLAAGGAFPSLARDRSLVYAVDAGGGPLQLVAVERDGSVARRVAEPRPYLSEFALSPDGRTVAVQADEGGNVDIWLYDLASGARTRASFGAEAEVSPAWLGDGETLLFSRSDGSQSSSTMARPADGGGAARALFEGGKADAIPGSDVVVFERVGRRTAFDLHWVSLAEPDSVHDFLVTPLMERGPALSPDGRYVAYMSNESGANEVYLRSFPSGEGKWQISQGGGAWPRWAFGGWTLVFRSGSGSNAAMMAVEVEPGPAPRIGAPERLFDAQGVPGLYYESGFPAYDWIPGTDQLLMYERGDRDQGPRLVFVEDWWATWFQD